MSPEIQFDLHLNTVAEVATAVNLSVQSVYRAIYAGDLAVVRIGPKRGSIRIKDADVRAWLTSRTEVAA